MRNKKYLYILLIIIPIIIFFIGKSFSLTYTQEIRNVEIESNDYDDPGSFHIDKSAKWTGLGKAQIEFDVETVSKFVEGRNIDIVLVLDISGSMEGIKFERAISDAKDLATAILSTSGNRMALITFDTDSEIVSGFTSDKNEMLDYLDSLSTKGATNYNAGLLNVDEVLDGYTERTNTDLVTLFLTDGYPNVDVPTEKATYRILKDKYPYMTINGIQYEMGVDIIQDIIDISDNQWYADQETLNNVLFEASINPIRYETFVISDYINKDYFTVDSVDDIEVSRGQVELTTENGFQKVIWTLDNNISGFSAKMKINVDLKSEYHETDGFYPTNDHETINYNLLDEDEETVNSSLTPVLKNNYYVAYNTNAPTGCTGLPTYQNEKHYVYQTVTKKTDILTCPGYVFKGWEIEGSNQNIDIEIINDDTFIMPAHDVTIKGTWAKENLVKSMDGTIRIKLDGTLARQYSSISNTFGKAISRSSFESVKTVDNIDVPSNAIDSWDASAERNGSVIAWYTDTDSDSKYELYIGQEDGVKANPNSSYAFSSFTYASLIELEKFDTSNVTDMSIMFYNSGDNAATFELRGLEELDTSKVTNMSRIFEYLARNATTVDIGDISGWDTSNVTNMAYMFNYAGKSDLSWDVGDLSGWNTSKVTNMNNMFNYAGYSSTTWDVGDLSGWDVSNVEEAQSMFYYAGYKASTFDIGNIGLWNTGNMTNMRYMFSHSGYSAPTWNVGNISNWNTSKVTDMAYMFDNAGKSDNTWIIGDLSNWNTGSVTDMSGMFYSASTGSTTWNVGNLDNWNVSNVKNMSYMFDTSGQNATTWNVGNLSNWNVSNVTKMYRMFAYAGNKDSTFNIGNLNNWSTGKVTTMYGMFYSAGSNATTWNIGSLNSWDTSHVTSMCQMFSYAGSNASTFDIGNIGGWDVSNVTDMNQMFQQAGVRATTYNIGNLSNWNTGSVTNMNRMFYGSGAASTTWSIGDLSNWNVSNVTDMTGMFSGTGKVTSNWNIGSLSSWTTSKVTTMEDMFSNAGYNSLSFQLNLTSWDTSSVTSFYNMFSSAGYSATTWSIGDLSNWNVSNATAISQMFYKAGYSTTTWTIGDLSGWDTKNVTSMRSVFDNAGYSASSFDIGNLNNWDTSKVKYMNSMFSHSGYSATTWNIGNLSSWNVSSVTSMESLFYYAGYNATTWSIGDLSGWDTSKVTTMIQMFAYAGYNATTWNSIGTLKVYATNLINMFRYCRNAQATLNIYSNPTSYNSALSYSATLPGSGITVNYSSNTTNIDNIIATKTSDSNVVKGVQLD